MNKIDQCTVILTDYLKISVTMCPSLNICSVMLSITLTLSVTFLNDVQPLGLSGLSPRHC